MPSFDIVSEVDLQEVDNAVNQSAKEISTRFDFRGGKSEVSFDRETKKIKIVADDDMKMRAIHQILATKLAKRGVDLRGLKYGKEESGSMGILRQEGEIKAGLDKDETKKVIKCIKDNGFKVTTEIQGEQVRVTSKKIDELQAVMQKLKTSDLGMPLNYINMRS